MKTPLFILLQATGGIRNEVNTFLSDYAVPVIAMLLIVGVGIGVVMNYDKIIDRDGQGTRKEGIVNLLGSWLHHHRACDHCSRYRTYQ